MLWPNKNSYKEFYNEKKFLRLENSPPPPPPSPPPKKKTLLMVRPLVRDKHDESFKEMCFHLCSTGIRFEDQNYSIIVVASGLNPELEPTVTACLADRDAQQVPYTGFVQTPSRDSKRLRFLPYICNAGIHKAALFAKHIPS